MCCCFHARSKCASNSFQTLGKKHGKTRATDDVIFCARAPACYVLRAAKAPADLSSPRCSCPKEVAVRPARSVHTPRMTRDRKTSAGAQYVFRCCRPEDKCTCRVLAVSIQLGYAPSSYAIGWLIITKARTHASKVDRFAELLRCDFQCYLASRDWSHDSDTRFGSADTKLP